jgi:DNA-binding NarL/FixJ family response regulator
MNQITQAEQEVFALDGHSISATQDIFHKEECTIKNQRRSILKKLNTPSMTEAVQQFQNLHQEPSQKLIRTS